MLSKKKEKVSQKPMVSKSKSESVIFFNKQDEQKQKTRKPPDLTALSKTNLQIFKTSAQKFEDVEKSSKTKEGVIKSNGLGSRNDNSHGSRNSSHHRNGNSVQKLAKIETIRSKSSKNRKSKTVLLGGATFLPSASARKGSEVDPNDNNQPVDQIPTIKKEEPVELDPAVASVYARVFSGKFKQIPTPLSKLVRVFTSSTFTDTTLERNALMEDVYPNLKRYCREIHGLDFQVVDMRWGVRDEATDDHMTTNLCINEIRNCQRLSTGANFVVFLCQKYGYRPIPSEVLSSELEVLKRILKEHQTSDVSLLDTWFIEDLNSVPSRFILQPISSILVNFNNKRIPKLQEQDAKMWWEIEAKMQNMLRKGAKFCYERGYFTYEQMHNYFMSVTEREVIEGILKAKNPNDHCLCYVRHIKNINIDHPNVAAKYIDIMHKQINVEAQKLLANLRDERVPSKLRVQNIRRSTVEWTGHEGMDTNAHAQYLREFCADFYTSVTNMVDAAMRKQAKYRDVFFAEVLQHLWNAVQGSHLFFGRENELAMARNYLRDPNVSIPLILYGEHGCGKTSILAKIATQARSWLHEDSDEEGGVTIMNVEDEHVPVPTMENDDTQDKKINEPTVLNDGKSNRDHGNKQNEKPSATVVERDGDKSVEVDPVFIIRFLGTSPDSSSIAPLLISVCEQIAYNYNLTLRLQCPTEISKLFQHFKKMTTLATMEKPLIIILDSLDLLSKMDASEELLWFPPTLPPHVKLIASLSSNTAVETNMHRLVEFPEQYVSVPALGPELGMEVIRNWLQAIGRTLTNRQSDLVAKALNYCSLPLFLKLVYATVARWKSYSKSQETVLFKSVQQSIHALFDRTENQHGKLLVSHALSYITAAKSGVSDSELEDLISLDDKVLDDIYQYHLPPVRRIPPLLWSRIRADLPGYLSERAADGVIVLNWYHEQFRTAANERYFKNLNHLQNTHSAIADYFLGIWGGIPKPYQFTDLQKQRFGVLENEGLADRKVPKQPNLFRSKDSDKIRYNTRKLNELPYHLLRARRIKELFSLCLFNFEFLQAKLCSFPLQLVVADYEDAISKIEDADTCRQLSLVMDALRLSASLLSRYPYMLAFELLGRLLPLVPANNLLKTLLCGCDLEGPTFNCFLPVHHCFHSPGGPLKYSLEEHPFAVFGMQLSSNCKNLASTSNQLIVWDVQTGDLTRIINPNIEGIFLGMALSADDRLSASYTNNNQVVIISLITGDYHIVDPDGMDNQMAIEHITFTPDNCILLWSSTEFYIYDTDARLLHSERLSETVLVYVFYASKHSVCLLATNTDRENWNVTVFGRENGILLKPFVIAASLTFFDDTFRGGACCIPQNLLDVYRRGAHPPIEDTSCTLDTTYAVIRFNIDDSGRMVLVDVLAQNLDDKANALIFRKTYSRVKAQEGSWLIIVTIDNFWLCERLDSEHLIQLKLPPDVRNIPIKPMHTTSTVALSCGDTVFVAGIRKNLYIWNINSAQLVRTVDAHFGRILNLQSLNLNNHNLLISSSIDRSIKIWNMENIFEKSFALTNMDQAIENILIARRNTNLAITQSRKYLGVWDIRSHRFITSLMTNAYGSVVMHSVITTDSRYVVCVESDNLLVWDLKTQSINHRLSAPNVHQILFVDSEKLLDGVTVIAVAYSKGHDYLHVIGVREKCIRHRFRFRPRALKKHESDVVVLKLIAGAMEHQCVVMDGETRGAIWDVKNRKLVRNLPNFTGVCTEDGKLGLHAPNRGGLHIIDMKSGTIIRTLIGQVAEGVNDVQARFTPNGSHVLYYHSGHQTLRIFRVANGQLIGTLRPHAQITTWSCDHNGEKIAIGGQDGSLLTVLLHDTVTFPNIQRTLASLPSRRYLAEYLGLRTNDLEKDDNLDLRNLGVITKAVSKFKMPLKSSKKGSVVCSIQ